MLSESFASLYGLLYDYMKRAGVDSQDGITYPMLQALTKRNSQKFNQIINNEFSNFDSGRKGYWTFSDFKKWCLESRVDGICVSYENISVTVPLHLAYRQNLK